MHSTEVKDFQTLKAMDGESSLKDLKMIEFLVAHSGRPDALKF